MSVFETVVYVVFLSPTKQLPGYKILCFWWQINALKFSQMIAASLLTSNKFLEIQMRCKFSEIYSIMEVHGKMCVEQCPKTQGAGSTPGTYTCFC